MKAIKEIKYLMDQIQGRIKEAAICGENYIRMETHQYPAGKKWETVVQECIEELEKLGFNVIKEAAPIGKSELYIGKDVFPISGLHIRW